MFLKHGTTKYKKWRIKMTEKGDFTKSWW